MLKREELEKLEEYTLTEYDIVSGRIFDDTIALGSLPIDIHDQEGKELNVVSMRCGKYYGIQYRCLISNDINYKELKERLLLGKQILE